MPTYLPPSPSSHQLYATCPSFILQHSQLIFAHALHYMLFGTVKIKCFQLSFQITAAACNELNVFLWFCGSRRQQSLAPDICRWCTPPPRPSAQIIEGCKKFCNAFLKGGFTDLNEIWHYGGFTG